jgi:CheY-like chemotaxis protein
MEYRLRRHDGEFRWMISHGVPRYRADGGFEGYIGSCFDVTDYKNAQAALREADRRKDEFLATLSHELRNPLAPIRNGLQMIRLAGATGTIEQARTMMERQLGQMIRLVDDLLDVSRVTTGKLVLQTARVDLQTVIDAALETTRAVIEQAGHALSVTVPQDPIFVDGDATRLAQVLSNLLNNSAKYTPPGGRIQLRAGSENGMAILAVQDDGIGIPPDMLASIFEMFTQVDRTLEKSSGGLGIGLSLVKGLVEMHGGLIEVRSDAGRGSEFIVRLPTERRAAQAAASPAAIEPTAVYRRRRILVADDNVDAAESMRLLLEMLGNTVSTANDGIQAVDVAEAFRPELILLDIGMPRLNGYDACRQIRERDWGKSALIVAMTGWGQDEDKRRSLEIGFDQHLVKPVDPEALEKLLATLDGSTG